jgi:Integrase core domain
MRVYVSADSNGMCERFHRTMLDEFYRIAFRKKIYRTLDELQIDVDAWIYTYNHDRPHSGRDCYGKTPMQTLNVHRVQEVGPGQATRSKRKRQHRFD